MTIINSLADIRTWVANSNPANVLSIEPRTALEQVTRAIQAADHPDYGTDWAEWLESNAEKIAIVATDA